MNSRCLAASGISFSERAVAHATRGCDGYQEGRERGYYHLHRNLNNSLLQQLKRLKRLLSFCLFSTFPAQSAFWDG